MTDGASVTRAEAEQLVLRYNRVTAQCPNVPRDNWGRPVGRKVTRKSVEEATAFLRFCAEHAIDPERWIVARHVAVAWKTRLPLGKLAKVGDNYLAHFKTWGDAAAHEATRAVEPVEDLGKPGIFSEQLKATYASAPDLCMVMPDTRGWHPASTWCERCALADPCRRRLPAAARLKRASDAG